MSVSAKEMIARLDPELRAQVEARAAELIAEETARRALRRARNRARTNLAKAMHLTVKDVSEIEQRSDLLFSAFQKTVAATGGRLSLVAEFPDRPRIVLHGFSGDEPERQAPGRKIAKKALVLAGSAT